MATHLAGLVTIILVIGGSAMAGSEESRWRRKNNGDSDEATSSSGSTCPCTRGCCDHGWIQYKDACYLPELQHKKSWDSAEEYCVGQEAHLASVHSSEEDNFILHLMGNAKLRSYWLGAKRIRQGEEFHWTWTDQTQFQYEKIPRSLAPKENDNHLAAMRWNNEGTIVWSHRDGSHSFPFICKYFLV
ncbi:snaclec macrovipecetin subunit beta-like [Sphaerodactylus townsendi]|uniref:snaclec macrovipecetin subunit beta-like n=1 Tax=Sphaerodactylus townsendi TaxID=933632 RepID=UPI0020260852|nr:snaclec macrovipecetin subunit beta-like [Sphaerodactylus townsendi]